MSKPVSHQKKILVVDDEPSVYQTIRILLEFDGHEVVTVDSGAGALALFDQNRFDLVITDYTMPGMKGSELAVALKARLPGLPVIMITAHVDMLKTNSEALTGVDHLVGKPFELADLRDAIEKVTTR
jgi:CheY-like chemotaxis protein